jgi:hypothetical protein
LVKKGKTTEKNSLSKTSPKNQDKNREEIPLKLGTSPEKPGQKTSKPQTGAKKDELQIGVKR